MGKKSNKLSDKSKKSKQESCDESSNSKAEYRKKKWESKREKSNYRGRKNYQSSEEVAFAKMMYGLGLEIRYMEGDGNCMFRSIADQLEGDSEQHGFYRQKIIDYVQKNSDHFRLFIEDDEPFDDYVERMRQDGQWGGHPELFAASQCLFCHITVHQTHAPRLLLPPPPDTVHDSVSVNHTQREVTVRKAHSMHLSYHGDQHYNSVRLLGDNTSTPALPITLSTSTSTAKSPVEDRSHGSEKSRHSLSSEVTRRVRDAVPWLCTEAIDWAVRVCEGEEGAAIELLMTDPEGYLMDSDSLPPERECVAEGDESRAHPHSHDDNLTQSLSLPSTSLSSMTSPSLSPSPSPSILTSETSHNDKITASHMRKSQKSATNKILSKKVKDEG